MKYLCYFALVSSFLFFTSCSSVKYKVKKDLPKYKTEKTFEYGIKKVWAATYNVISKNANIEIAEEDDGIIKTDWNQGPSDINTAEYEINGIKKFKTLNLRYRYTIILKKVFGGTKIKIESEQEYEKISKDPDVPSNSWVSTCSSTAREKALLDEIETELLK